MSENSIQTSPGYFFIQTKEIAPGVNINLVNGQVVSFTAPSVDALAPVEEWLDTGLMLGDEDATVSVDGRTTYTVKPVEVSEADRADAVKTGEGYVQHTIHERGVSPMADCPLTLKDFATSFWVTPFGHVTDPRDVVMEARARTQGRIALKAAKTAWAAQRAKGGGLPERLMYDIAEIEIGAQHLGPEALEQLGEAAVRLIRLLTARATTHTK